MQPGVQSDPSGFETLETFSGAHAFNSWLYDQIKEYTQGQILEIGSGIGNISSFLLKEQQSVSLSDLRPEYCQLLKNKFRDQPGLQRIIEMDLSLTGFREMYTEYLEKFDTVIALNVIEHIADDSLAILNAKSLLRKNGKMIILVPAGQWLYNQLDKELGHYKRYTMSGLNEILKSAGLHIFRSKYFNAAAIFGWWLSGKILKDKMISTSKLHFYNRLVPLFKVMDWFVKPFTGISVISVGVKK